MRNWNYYIKKTTAIMIASGMVVMTGCADKGQGAAADASGQAETVVQANSQGQDNRQSQDVSSAPDQTETEARTESDKTEKAVEEKSEVKQAETEAAEQNTEKETDSETETEATKAPVEVKPVYRVTPETEADTEAPAQTEAVTVAAPVQTEAQTEAAFVSADKLTAPFGIAFLGDSITVGYKSGYSYADVVCEDLGCVQFNYGISGNTLASNGGEGFVERYKSINPDCRVIVVYGGSNDYYNNVALGSPDSTRKDEFYGGLKKLCSGLKESYPDANIVFLTPLPGEFGGMHNSSNNETGSSMWDYVDAMQKVCAKYDIPVIDLYHNFSINADNYDSYTSDGLHPNEEGHSLIAKAVEKYIKSLM